MSSFLSLGHAPLRLGASIVSALVLCGAVPAVGAQTVTSIELEPVVVTATRVPTPLPHVLSDTTVLARAELERQRGATVAEVLRRVGGLQMSNNGGRASTSSLFMRGADSRHVAVMVDGVRVDTQSGAGGATWEALPLEQIERIEIVRGPASAVYGSDAIAGVVQVFTRKGRPGAPRLNVGASLGTQGTRAADASVSGGTETLDYAFSAGAERSNGFNAVTDTASFYYRPDRDGYTKRSASGRMGYALNVDHRLEVSALHSKVRAQYDGFNDGTDPDDISRHGVDTLQARWAAQWLPNWSSQVVLGQSKDHYDTTPSPYRTDTRVRTVTWQNDVKHGPHRLQATLERREDALDNPSLDGFSLPIDASRHQNSVALGYGWHEGQGPVIQANLRHDRDSEFGGQTTGSLGVSVPMGGAWRAHATAGTGFRAPTLYQRFSEYGQAALVPERSRNIEAGVAYADGASSAKATVFRTRLTQLIDYDPALGGTGACASPFGCYDNVGSTATLQGLSLKGGVDWQQVQFAANVDFLSARNNETGLVLARRARRTANVSVDTDLMQWQLGADWHLAASRFDRADNLKRLGGYGTLALRAQRPVGADWSVQVRADNVTDTDYQLAGGYATAPRSLFVGMRWAPR